MKIQSLQHRTARRDEAGFTLIELLLVIVILGVLAGITVFSVRGITDRGEVSACKSEVSTVETATEAYYAKNGNYPGSTSTLVSGGFIKSEPTYVSGVNSSTGALTLSGAPSGCTA